MSHEAAGQNHGIITREQAWGMWAPYGERMVNELDPVVTAENLKPEEVPFIVRGASDRLTWQLIDLFDGLHDDVTYELVQGKVAEGPSDELVAVLAKMQDKQTLFARKRRDRELERGGDYTRLLISASRKLVKEGVLTKTQQQTAEGWMIDPDGNPMLQYTPVSNLESARYLYKYCHAFPNFGMQDVTSFFDGTMVSVVIDEPDFFRFTRHNKPHESAQAGLAGAEIWDITRDDGMRVPSANVIGHFAFEPSTENNAENNYAQVENFELAEGVADFLAREMMRVEPRLGRPLPKGNTGYAAWAAMVGTIRRDMPALYAVIMDACFVEATPAEPNAKRAALAEMHAFADKIFGEKDSLNAIFVEAGGEHHLKTRVGE